MSRRDSRFLEMRSNHLMAETPETHNEAPHRLGREFEDPHYHDDEEAVPLDNTQPRAVRPPSRKPARRIPPPKRRFYEE
jgi:hypothetical protein